MERGITRLLTCPHACRRLQATPRHVCSNCGLVYLVSASDIRDVRRLVRLQLSRALPQQELNRAKVLSVHVYMLLELSSGEAFEVGTSLGWLLSCCSQAVSVECEDVALKTRKASHDSFYQEKGNVMKTGVVVDGKRKDIVDVNDDDEWKTV